MKIKFALSVAVVLSGMTINAQESVRVIEDVILFQSEAHLVRMTEKGKILAFLKDIDNNYAALNSVTTSEIMMAALEVDAARDLGRSEKSLLPENDAQLADNAMDSEVTEDVVVIDQSIAEDMDEAIAEDTGRADEDLMSKGDEDKTTNYDYEFAFDHRDASLSPSVVNQLNQIAEILKTNQEVSAEIKSYYSETVDVSKILSKNRAKGIQDQLVAQGIDRSRIKISESNNEDWANNRVKLSIN